MILKIRKTDDPILRQPAEEVVDFGHEFQFLVDNMVDTMRKNNGVGLAAPQVGIAKKIFVCEFTGDPDSDLKEFPLTVIANPEIVEYSKEKRRMVEGCLSFPGMEILVSRPEKIIIKGQDRYGKPIEIKACDLYGRVLQHENDHLHSTLLIDHIEESKVLFIGTGTLGEKSLELLAKDAQYKICTVITGEPKKIIKRGKKRQENPIIMIAKKYNLPIIETNNIKDSALIEKIKKLKPDIGIMADFGQIVPEELLNIPTHGVINIHPSLLPKYRGPSPVQQVILDGEKLTGVTLILTSAKMDAGDIISQVEVEISSGETCAILKEYLGETGASLLLNSIPYYLAGDLKPIKQDESKATYTKIFKSEDGQVDNSTPAKVVERKIRALNPWPRVYTIVDRKRILLLAAHFEEDGALSIDRVKPEGKAEMSYQDWARGYKKVLEFKK